MFRTVAKRLGSSVQAVVRSKFQPQLAVASIRQSSSLNVMTDEEYDDAYVKYLNRTDIDGWDIRRVINRMQGEDLVPEPKIIIAALHACRRVSDYALAVRYLEAIHNKCGKRAKEIWPYIIQEIQPTLTELGVSTPADMGYDKPELALKCVDDIHG